MDCNPPCPIHSASFRGTGGKPQRPRTAPSPLFKNDLAIAAGHGVLPKPLIVAPRKIIAEMRGWFPTNKIVGWKFEADGKRADAVTAARKQIAECLTDLCVVNGPAYGEGFGLVQSKGEAAHLASPPVLFDVLEKLAGK